MTLTDSFLVELKVYLHTLKDELLAVEASIESHADDDCDFHYPYNATRSIRDAADRFLDTIRTEELRQK